MWDGLDEEGLKECEHTIQTRKDWVVWSQSLPMKGDCAPEGLNTWEKMSSAEKLIEARKINWSLKQKKG